MKQSVLVFLGMGVIGGIGCGLGYIAPVSTLVKWFPDRRGMATGMAIMGFGGGAFLAGSFNRALMEQLVSRIRSWRFGVDLSVVMMLGARISAASAGRLETEGWTPPVKTTDDHRPQPHCETRRCGRRSFICSGESCSST